MGNDLTRQYKYNNIDKYKPDLRVDESLKPKVNNSFDIRNNKNPTLEYLSQYKFNNDSTTNTDDTNYYMDAMAQALKDGNYKTYFNRQLQLANLAQAQRKYGQNQAIQQGLATQGYGSSNQVQANNAVLQQYAQNQQDYDTQNMQIENDALERYNQEAASKDASLINAITSSNGDMDAVKQYMISAGFMNQDGSYTQSYNDLSSDRKYQIDMAIAQAKTAQSAIDKQYNPTGATYNGVDLYKWLVSNGHNTPLNSQSLNENQTKALESVNYAKDGSIFSIGNSSYIKLNNAYYQISPDEALKAQNVSVYSIDDNGKVRSYTPQQYDIIRKALNNPILLLPFLNAA